jgi:hypothetical protein
MQLSSMQGESLRVDEPKAPLSIKLKTLDVSHSETRSKADRGQRGQVAGAVAKDLVEDCSEYREVVGVHP